MGEFMNKNNQSSLIDFLVNRGQFSLNGMNVISIHSKQAKNLYEIFVSAVSQDGHIKIAKPLTMHTADFIELYRAGLVSGDQSDISITKNGGKLLEKMILSDDDCTFALKTVVAGKTGVKLERKPAVEGLLPRGPGVFRL